MDKTGPEKGKGNLLVVDDDLHFRQTLEALLIGEGYEVRCAASGRMALMFAAEETPELILLDVRLPDMDGFEVCRRLRGSPATERTPVIFISGLDEVGDKVKGFAAGGMDYITKPYQGEEVLARVGLHVELVRAKEALRRTNDILEQRVAERTVDIENRLRFERLISDISAGLVNIPPDRVDPEIESGLKRILEFFGVDRCALLRSFPDKNFWQISHMAARENMPPIPVRTRIPISANPWAHDKVIGKGEVLSFSSLDDLPPEAKVDRQTWIEWGIRSNLNIPISIGGPVDRVFAVNSVTSECAWPEEYVARLRLVGEIFVNALERKENRLELEERLRFEKFVSEISARFVNIRPENVDSQIEHTLGRILDFFQVDRCALIESPAEKAIWRVTHIIQGPDVPSLPMRTDLPVTIYPWSYEKLTRRNEVVAFSRPDDLPPEA
ncbi:MAG TPA: response regulator, partial [Thermodesulfobacteriota bacterium]|nr:response regulator [Thermodesulfobacteriota bacterium]